MILETFHIAAQYLATVSISFLDKKEDDSHSNLGWKDGALHTHPLSEDNCIFSLDYKSFSLIWTNDLGYKKSIDLNGKTHSEIIHWIRQTSLKAKHNKVYEYKLHYKLPYEAMTSNFVFQKPTNEEIQQLIDRRDLAQKALENALKRNTKSDPVRVWPHHFDSGSFFTTDNGIGIALGMAIPDEIVNNFYFYVNAYRGNDGIELSPSLKIEKGNYYSDGWKGIARPVSEASLDEATDFYKQSLNIYLNQ